MPQLIDLVIDGSIFFDIGIGRGDICLRLIVVIIAHEIAHIVFREKGLELAGKLRRKGLVMGNHERRPLHLFDDLRNGIGLACACRPQKHLCFLTVLDARRKILDGLGLISHRLEGCHDLKGHLLIELHRIELRNHRHLPLSFSLINLYYEILASASHRRNRSLDFV